MARIDTMLSEREQNIADGLVLAGARVTTNHISIQLTGKANAEWLYNEVQPIAETRDIEATGDRHLGREFYLELSDSPRITLDNEDDFEWNHTSIWEVSFIPTDDTIQHVHRWFEHDERPHMPRDFALMPITGKVLYLTRAFELYGSDRLMIEFETYPWYDDITEAFDAISIDVERDRGLYRINEDDAQQFREYIGVSNPRPQYDDRHGGD